VSSLGSQSLTEAPAPLPILLCERALVMRADLSSASLGVNKRKMQAGAGARLDRELRRYGVEKCLYFEWLLKRATGSQHLGDVEEV
jgi:hypothetical protein